MRAFPLCLLLTVCASPICAQSDRIVMVGRRPAA